MVSAPRRYPATEEKTTDTESRTLVISVKLPINVWGTEYDWETDKFFFLRCKDTAPYIFSQYIYHILTL